MPNPEHHPHGAERAESPRDLERAPEVMDKKAEVAPESEAEHEKKVEEARAEAAKEAISGRETSQGEHKKEHKPATPIHRTRKESYDHTMRGVQAELSAPARVFSKVIHNPIVERTSEVIGNTVARPDAILSGSVFACLLVLGLYVLARYNGFALSGFETIGAFIVGWVIGIVFDFLRAMITGKRQ